MELHDYKDTIHRCFRCGYCKYTSDFSHYNCPMYHKYRTDSHMPGGILWLIRAVMTEELEATPAIAEILFGCTMCGNCCNKCPMEFHEKIVDMITAARMYFVEKQIVPPMVRKYLMNMINSGNPWNKSHAERGRWAEGSVIRRYRKGDDFLFYVGDMGSYDERAIKTSIALGELFYGAGMNFGILGCDEQSDGNDVGKMGERDLLSYLAEENIGIFQQNGVEAVCTLSPHAYHSIKNLYPPMGGSYAVYHYTQLLWDLMQKGRLAVTGRIDKKIAFHDPCLLGRWNLEYEAPRELLKAIPGTELAELPRNRSNALCCGGGGGNCYTDVLGSGRESPSRVRVREAYENGIEILAVACPTCMLMLEDALKEEELWGKMEIKDVAEILMEAR